MLFAAGLGTRLKPITENCPKALVKVNGFALLEIAIQQLQKNGIESIILNVHHFADQVEAFLKSKKWDVEIHVSDERDRVLETGGGLKKAGHFFKGESDFLVTNVDVLSNIDLKKMLKQHQEKKAIATLAVRNRISSRYLLFNEEDRLVGWKNEKTGAQKLLFNKETIAKQQAFSGIQIISSQFLENIRQEGKFSIIETYLDQGKNHLIQAYDHTDDLWLDVGTHPSLEKATKLLPLLDKKYDLGL